MKQGARFFLKPSAFVNQLQWSSHHSFILSTFCTTALIETQVGRNHALYAGLASILANHYGLGFTLAIWLVTFLKLTITMLGAVALVEMIGFLGGMFGRQSSRRVLFRRLAVVFSIVLLANTLNQCAAISTVAAVTAVTLFLWGLMLGFFTLREQFGLTFGEASTIGVFSLCMVVCTWHFSLIYLQRSVRLEQQLAKRPVTHARMR
jgi:hypothetical protein